MIFLAKTWLTTTVFFSEQERLRLDDANYWLSMTRRIKDRLLPVIAPHHVDRIVNSSPLTHPQNRRFTSCSAMTSTVFARDITDIVQRMI